MILRKRQHRAPPLLGAEKVPGLVVPSAGKTLLYIGASRWRQDLLPELASRGWIIDIIEIFKENVDFLREHCRPPRRDGGGVRSIIHGDVRTELLGSYDAAVWWHGPEHVPEEDLPAALGRLEKAARLVVLAAPFDDPASDPDAPPPYGNPHERHLWPVLPEDLQALGYETIKVPRPRSPAIVAWKVAEDAS